MWYTVEGKYAYIPLSGERGKGLRAKVDLEDIPRIAEHSTRWCLRKAAHHKLGYAQAWSKKLKKVVGMHNIICPTDPGFSPDHINYDTLDNTQANLRPATARNQQINKRKRSGTSSNYPGVRWHKGNKKWYAEALDPSGKYHHLGCFLDEKLAARVYRDFVKQHGFPGELEEWKDLDETPVVNNITNYFNTCTLTNTNQQTST